jgi:Zn-dependent peptidase ImmA (M78 family)
MRVPWMSKDKIAGRAYDVLVDYQALVGREVQPPIPVEDIIERYLGLNLSFENLEEALDMRGVLGATYVRSRRVCINENLLEKRYEGRMIFTCAHEAGHWVLHRYLVEEAKRFGPRNDTIICRKKNAKLPIEWQADYFATSLLMPEDDVRSAFCMACDTDVLVLNNVLSSLGGTALCIDPCVQNWTLIADVVREAGGFSNVSKQAMMIRMLELGLVVNLTGTRIGWDDSFSKH